MAEIGWNADYAIQGHLRLLCQSTRERHTVYDFLLALNSNLINLYLRPFLSIVCTSIPHLPSVMFVRLSACLSVHYDHFSAE